ncbi:MAG: S9 family peptidase [Acidobacteriota bacterium]|nr:S9 family peptidase [Acidobacteriota bacterium]MDH3784675.1 S9 family peptidase [Acidobacteriota bacterium]
MLPLESFFRKPERTVVRISCGGQRIAWMAPYERRLNIYTRDLTDGTEMRVTAVTDRDLSGYTWVSDTRLLYARDTGGDENYHLFAVDHDGGNPVDLTPFDGVKCELVDDLPDVDDEVLVQMNRRVPELFDVHRLNVVTGDLTIVAENPGNVQSWITDHNGQLRAAMTTDGVHSSLLFRESEQDSWKELASYDFKEYARPLAFTFDNRRLYVTSNLKRDKAAIFVFDPADSAPSELIYEHPEVDVANLIYSRVHKRLLGVAFETDRIERVFFDDEGGKVQALVDSRLPHRENSLVSESKDESRFIVHSGTDRDLGSYHLVDATEMTVEKLFDVSPWLDPDQLAPMEPIRYTARDGLTIPGYLTLPAKGGGRPLPTIVLPHGGPWHRDSWGFNPEIQFLANRGYAVLQMNFRGSAGFGRAFMEKGFGEWGKTMQDDISDAVAWAVDRGTTDPKAVAIYGGSYGGYAALAGVTLTPELYACGVSYVGVSNIFTWIESIPPYWKPYLEMIYEMVGHPERDAERLRATSPLFHVDNIRCPLLVAQGANDPRVPKAESDQIVAVLRERSIDVEYLVKDDEGHGFTNEENRFEFYRLLEAFLARHMPS